MGDRARTARVLSMRHVLAIGVNAIVGAGIYFQPGRAAGALGPAALLAWIACGGFCAVVALAFAEASRRFDGSGGPYRYADAAFGARFGYAMGVVCWVTSVFSWATVAHGLGGELARATGSGDGTARAFAVGTTLGLGALNYLGVRLGARVVLGLTLLKLVPLAVVLVAGLLLFDGARFVPLAPHGYTSFGATTLFILFAYQGFEVAPVPAGETRGARDAVPRAVLLAVGATMLIYLAINTVAIGGLPDLAGAPDPLYRLATRAFGPHGATVLRIGGIVSTFGFSAGVALVCPHYVTALADDRHLPDWIARRHPRFGGPTRATVLCTSVTAVLCATLDFSRLLDFSNEAVCVQYLVTAASVVVLGRRDPPGARPPAWRSLVVPAGAAAITVWLASHGDWKGWLAIAGTVGLGFAARAALRPRL